MASSSANGKRRAEEGGRSNGQKRSKEGRGDDRDRPGGKGGWKGKGKGASSSSMPSGPGIYASVTRGKERQAAFQLIDILEDFRERLYPGVTLEDEASTSALSKPLDEDDFDAMRNGTASAPVAAPQDSESKKANDIEDQIAAELAELKGDGKARTGGSNAPSQRRKPFVPVFLDMECVVFIRVAKPIDPNVIVYALLDEVRQTGRTRSHHVQRLTPVYDTTRADLPDITDLVAQTFSAKVGKEAQTYKIDTRIRLHGQITRQPLIQGVATRLADMTRGDGEDAETKTESDGLSRLRVDLDKPDVVVHIEIYKMVAAVGILHDVEKYCKLNPLTIADAVQKETYDKEQGKADATE